MGPGVVIGHQSCNAWISYAGRCCLVAPEHLRTLAPDEICSTKPLIRQGLEELKRASKSSDHVDITRQDVTTDDLQQAAEQPAGNDHSGEPVESVLLPPVVNADPNASATEVEVLEPPEEEMQGELTDIQDDVEMHFEEPGESSAGAKPERVPQRQSERTQALPR